VRIGSVRLRLTLWYSAAAGVALLLMSAGAYFLIDRLFAGRSVFSLIETAGVVVGASGSDPTALARNVTLFGAPDRRLLLYSSDGRFLAESQQTPFRGLVAGEIFSIPYDHPMLTAAVRSSVTAARDPGSETGGGEGMTTLIESPGGQIVRLIRWPPPGTPEFSRQPPNAPILLVLGTTRDQQFVAGIVRQALVVTLLVTLLLAVVPGYFLARRSMAPVSVMTKRAAEIGAENLSERLPVSDRGDELDQLAAVLNDLLDRLQRAFHRQRQFMASAAHELRTPVAVVRGEAELALSREERPTSEYREALESVRGEALRMSRAVDELLTLSRSESGQLRAKTAPMDLRQTIDETVRSLVLATGDGGMTIEVDLPAKMPFEGDPMLLQRVFSNLIENALKHGGPNTRVEISGGGTKSGYEIQVRDHGRGVPPEDVEHIFEPFFRSENGRDVDGTAGTGLGLPIARASARLHGGDVTLVSSGPSGSTFRVTLPPDPAGPKSAT
jgi:heavy metal sensor kinase